jgi:hypothetical protein
MKSLAREPYLDELLVETLAGVAYEEFTGAKWESLSTYGVEAALWRSVIRKVMVGLSNSKAQVANGDCLVYASSPHS